MLAGQIVLLAPFVLFARGRNRRDQLRLAPALERQGVEGLALGVQRVVAAGLQIGRVQDRMFEKAGGHESPQVSVIQVSAVRHDAGRAWPDRRGAARDNPSFDLTHTTAGSRQNRSPDDPARV